MITVIIRNCIFRLDLGDMKVSKLRMLTNTINLCNNLCNNLFESQFHYSVDLAKHRMLRDSRHKFI